jgi:hypothetical protein
MRVYLIALVSYSEEGAWCLSIMTLVPCRQHQESLKYHYNIFNHDISTIQAALIMTLVLRRNLKIWDDAFNYRYDSYMRKGGCTLVND